MLAIIFTNNLGSRTNFSSTSALNMIIVMKNLNFLLYEFYLYIVVLRCWHLVMPIRSFNFLCHVFILCLRILTVSLGIRANSAEFLFL